MSDLKENSRVCLPKQLPPAEEASIEMRRNIYKKLFDDFKEKNCRKNGDQKPNLTKTAQEGVDSLNKRINEGQIVVLNTDKSGKFAIVTVEKYLEMGGVHTAGDKRVSRLEIREIEKQLNGHTSQWIKMTGMGEGHRHESRTRE